MAEQSQINKLDRILKQNIEDMEKATEANLISVPPRAGAETGNFILLNGFCPRINLFHSFPSFTYSAAFLLLLLRPHGS